MAIQGKVRKVVAEDIDFGTSTVSIQKADGTIVTANQVNASQLPTSDDRNVENIIKGVGYSIDEFTDLADAVAKIGSQDATLVIGKEVVLNQDLTVPENICLKFLKGGKITINAGYTLTIDGAIEAGLWQIFDGDGTVSGNPKIDVVYTEWFGVKGDGVTDDAIAINLANKFSIYNSPHKVKLNSNVYVYSTIKLNDYTLPTPVAGDGEREGVGCFDGGGGNYPCNRITVKQQIDVALQGLNLTGKTLRNITIDGNNLASIGIDYSFLGDVGGVTPSTQNLIENIWVEKCIDYGIRINQQADSEIRNIHIRGLTGTNPVALEFLISGGWGAIHDCQLYGGKTIIAAQNFVISNTIMTKELELTGASWNDITIIGGQFIDLNDFAINSTAIGNGTNSVTVIGVDLLDPAIAFVTGNFWRGITFINCRLYSSTGTAYLVSGIEAAAGTGYPPKIKFINCQFNGFDPTVNYNADNSPADFIFINCKGPTGNLIDNVYINSSSSLSKEGIEVKSIDGSKSSLTSKVLSMWNPNGYSIFEIKGSSGVFLDFAYDISTDYDARLILLGTDTFALAGADFQISDPGKGLILTSPSGTKYLITVDDTGNLVVTAV